jgi:hypothetical protein
MRQVTMKSTGKVILLTIIMSIAVIGAAAAQNEDVGAPNANLIGVDSAQQKLKEVSVSKFEDAGYWNAFMSPDQGIVRLRRFEGIPVEKEPIPGEEEAGIEEEDKYVLGLKVQYFGRGFKQFALMPVRPIPIEGITKTISVWVVGRNFNHVLKVMVADHFGNRSEITMGKMNFSGWRQLTVAVPPTLVQRDYHHSNRMGIKIVGFKIETDPMESYGTYYVYFDGLRAVTDLFAEENRDVDDFLDAW